MSQECYGKAVTKNESIMASSVWVKRMVRFARQCTVA